MNCQAFERYVDAVIDEEADPNAHMQVEQHAAGCSECRERMAFARWMKARIKEQPQIEAPDSLRARVTQSLAAEQDGAGTWWSGEASWRSTMAVAAVALLVFGVGGALQVKSRHMNAGFSPLFEDVVRAHTQSYPAEVARRDQVSDYFAEKVGFAVRPVDFRDPGVRFVGARHVEVGGRQAATLHYEASGRRMTVVAFRAPAQSADLGEVVDAGGRTLRYVRVGEHLVPLVQHGGVVYAVVGDLGPEDGLRLAASASLP